MHRTCAHNIFGPLPGRAIKQPLCQMNPTYRNACPFEVSVRVHQVLPTGAARINSAGEWKTGGTDMCRLGAIALSLQHCICRRDRRNLQECNGDLHHTSQGGASASFTMCWPTDDQLPAAWLWCNVMLARSHDTFTDAQTYSDMLEQQQRNLLAHFPSLTRALSFPGTGSLAWHSLTVVSQVRTAETSP
jgi:hypothetical protein